MRARVTPHVQVSRASALDLWFFSPYASTVNNIFEIAPQIILHGSKFDYRLVGAVNKSGCNASSTDQLLEEFHRKIDAGTHLLQKLSFTSF